MWPQSCGACDDAQAEHGGEYPWGTPCSVSTLGVRCDDAQAELDRLWAQSQPAQVRPLRSIRGAVGRYGIGPAVAGSGKDAAGQCSLVSFASFHFFL
jgi:hypothetical protein